MPNDHMESAPLILYDRSRVVTDWKCSRARYWNYEHDGTGVVPATSPLELYMGTTLHDGLAAIAQMHLSGGVDIDLIALTAREQMLQALSPSTAGELDDANFAWEQASLVEGLLRGFYKHAWPMLLAAYPKIIYVEQEMQYPHENLIFMSRPDLVLGSADGETIVYIEYKSTSSKKEGWINSWDTAVQLHSTVRAVEATTGTRIEQVVVQGLYKGYESYGKQSSPFCYAYRRAGNPPFSQDQISYEYKPGFKRFPTWELPGGVATWVRDMEGSVLASQFPQTPPIFVRDSLVDRFFEQRALRESEIALASKLLGQCESDLGREGILDAAFPQKFDQCVPGWGKPCSYRMLCHGPEGINPLERGYERRVPHHDMEVDRFKELGYMEAEGAQQELPSRSEVREGEEAPL